MKTARDVADEILVAHRMAERVMGDLHDPVAAIIAARDAEWIERCAQEAERGRAASDDFHAEHNEALALAARRIRGLSAAASPALQPAPVACPVCLGVNGAHFWVHPDPANTRLDQAFKAVADNYQALVNEPTAAPQLSVPAEPRDQDATVLTSKMLEMMRHAMGNARELPAARNYYCANVEGSEAGDWRWLVKHGYAAQGCVINGGRSAYFHVTASGLAAILRADDAAPPAGTGGR